MRDMSNIYRFKTVEELRLLKSLKLSQIKRLEHNNYTYAAKHDIMRVKHLVAQLDAELASRAAQMPLL